MGGWEARMLPLCYVAPQVDLNKRVLLYSAFNKLDSGHNFTPNKNFQQLKEAQTFFSPLVVALVCLGFAGDVQSSSSAVISSDS